MKDKELIKQEIERRINEYKNWIGYQNDSNYLELKELLQFIDSLPEEHNEDLEEAAEAFYDNSNIPKSSWWDEGVLHKMSESKETFIAGAEWQKKKDKQLVGATQKISHQHGYDEGRADMKDEMMKDAVDAFVNTYENTDDSNYVEFVTEQSPYKFKETEKCKIIIVKED